MYNYVFVLLTGAVPPGRHQQLLSAQYISDSDSGARSEFASRWIVVMFVRGCQLLLPFLLPGVSTSLGTEKE